MLDQFEDPLQVPTPPETGQESVLFSYVIVAGSPDICEVGQDQLQGCDVRAARHLVRELDFKSSGQILKIVNTWPLIPAPVEAYGNSGCQKVPGSTSSEPIDQNSGDLLLSSGANSRLDNVPSPDTSADKGYCSSDQSDYLCALEEHQSQLSNNMASTTRSNASLELREESIECPARTAGGLKGTP